LIGRPDKFGGIILFFIGPLLALSTTHTKTKGMAASLVIPEFERRAYMKIFTLSIYTFLAVVSGALSMGCYEHTRAVVVVPANGEVVHDNRWHYDNDHDGEWRSQHAWHNDTQDWDH
jgi:hypothetical protein